MDETEYGSISDGNSGQDKPESNFRSESEELSVKKSPVENPVSVAKARREGNLHPNKDIHYQDPVANLKHALGLPSDGARKDRNDPLENEQAPWEVEAMDYFKERLDGLHGLMLNVRENMGVLLLNFEDVLDRLERVEKILDERSESRVAEEQSVTIVLNGVPADAVEELSKYAGDLVKRKSGR